MAMSRKLSKGTVEVDRLVLVFVPCFLSQFKNRVDFKSKRNSLDYVRILLSKITEDRSPVMGSWCGKVLTKERRVGGSS